MSSSRLEGCSASATCSGHSTSSVLTASCFATDYPYVTVSDGGGRRFLEQARIGEEDREKIASGNWETVVRGDSPLMVSEPERLAEILVERCRRYQ